jgi:guanylate kinase
MNKGKGSLFIFSGPSGAGKDTVLSVLLKKRNDIYVSVSATTREMRKGEKQGSPYSFISKDSFIDMINKGEVLEYANYCGNYYGTPAKPVEEMLNKGFNVILKIDVQGAMKVKKKIDDAVMIFVVPPSLKVLKERLLGRGTEEEECARKRLLAAEDELSKAGEYDYIIINNDKDDAAADLSNIIDVQRFRAKRQLEILKGGY